MLSCGSHFNDMRINGLAYSPKTDSRPYSATLLKTVIRYLLKQMNYSKFCWPHLNMLYFIQYKVIEICSTLDLTYRYLLLYITIRLICVPLIFFIHFWDSILTKTWRYPFSCMHFFSHFSDSSAGILIQYLGTEFFWKIPYNSP